MRRCTSLAYIDGDDEHGVTLPYLAQIYIPVQGICYPIRCFPERTRTAVESDTHVRPSRTRGVVLAPTHALNGANTQLRTRKRSGRRHLCYMPSVVVVAPSNTYLNCTIHQRSKGSAHSSSPSPLRVGAPSTIPKQAIQPRPGKLPTTCLPLGCQGCALRCMQTAGPHCPA